MGKETTYQIEEYIRAFIISKLNVNGKAPRHDFRLSPLARCSEDEADVREDLLQYGIELVDLIVEAITAEVQERIDRPPELPLKTRTNTRTSEPSMP